MKSNDAYNADKATITADPNDSRFVYVTWDQGPPANIGFSRSTDGGETWEPLQGISNTHLAGVSQILVLPNGTLVNLSVQTTKDILQVSRSTDRGQTWSAPANAVTMVPVAVFDPNLGQAIRAPADVPSYAVDRQSGNLYVVWMDGRFSNLQYTDIAFSMSADGGVNWSSPIRVNQTPLNIPPGSRQAFVPVIAVAPKGTIGVSYYDFRFNGTGPALLTNGWFVQCQPSGATPPTNPANWGGEVRLTTDSFDLEMAVNWFGLFLGDYEGLTTVGDRFLAAFAAVDQNGATTIFTRRVGP